MANCKNLPLNYEELFELNITPDAGTGNETWERIAAGIMSVDIANNEDIAQDKYLDGNGFGTSTVIGAQKTLTFTGHYEPTDPVQIYIQSLEFELGNARCTQFRRTDALGNVVTGDVTIANIEFGGGDAGAKSDISFDIHFNGKPTKTSKQAASELTIVVAAGTVSGSTSFTATPAGTDTLAYVIKSVDSSTVYAGQYVSGVISYNSGDDITDVVAGQFLYAYELDENQRVVAFVSYELQAADILA